MWLPLMRSPVRFASGAACALLLAASLALAPDASAQPSAELTLEDLDALSDLTTDETGGLAFARDLAGDGRYLEALAAIERVLASHPRSSEGLLLHARYLCLIDDPQGGLVEIEVLRERDHDPAELAATRATCEARQGD
jgi:hypothetical protein